MTLGIVEGAVGSNVKSAWQVKKCEGREGGRELAEHGENSRVEGLFGYKPGQLSLSGMFKTGLGEDVC